MRDEYERDICARSEIAFLVPYRPVGEFDGWKPKIAACHENVDHWVKHHSGYTAVRGWLMYANFGGDLAGYTAHSVVCGPDGSLFDITPLYNNNAPRGRFIVHVGDEATFLAMRTFDLNIKCQGNCPAPPLDFDFLAQQFTPERDTD